MEGLRRGGMSSADSGLGAWAPPWRDSDVELEGRLTSDPAIPFRLQSEMMRLVG